MTTDTAKPMAKIEKLTPEQIARFPEFVEKWTAIGLSTQPADRPRAEAAIRKMYDCGGLKPPAKIVWCGSPMGQGITRAILLDIKLNKKFANSVGASVRDSVGASVGDSVWDSVGDSVWDSVWASVGDSVWASVGASVKDSVWASVRDSVWTSVGASVGASVWARVRDSVRDSVWTSVGDSVRASVYGSHDANWLAFYRYFHEVLSLKEQTKKLYGLWELCQSAGWALPYKNICWVSERHNILRRDDRGRLHCETGPACAYPDGFAIHAWHGVRIPSDWIENKSKLTPQAALKWQNVEQRRAACEIIGWQRILAELNAKTIDKDDDPQIGELVEVNLPDGGPARFLRVLCGTGRQFCLPVPRVMKTALQAQAACYDIPEDLMKLKEVRT